MIRFSAALAALALATPLTALAHAPSWTLNRAESKLSFTDTQTGKTFKGQFKKFAAVIAFSPSDLAASHIKVTVDLASAVTGNLQRDSAMRDQDWFDIAKSPQAIFTSTQITRLGANTYQAAGTLTLRGIRKKVILPFTVAITGNTAHATGHLVLHRIAYGVGQGPWASGAYVGLNVTVTLDIIATEKP